MNSSIEFPLVITTAFSPKSDVPYLAVKKGDLRTRETVHSIVWWICKSEFERIVIIETTGCDSLAEPLKSLAAACGKQLEYIAVENDYESVARYGKGFGEGFALDMAFDKSSILRDSEGFFKCTGKIIVSNYLACMRQARSKDFYFDAPWDLPNFVDTRFYFVSKEFWMKNLRYSYKDVNDVNGIFLEHVYFNSIARVSTIPFNSVVIRHSGTSGTSGDSYHLSFRKYVARVALRRGYGVYKWLRILAMRLTKREVI
ncbi:MAG: hypothetical protein ACYDBH_15570 [Acidobacteriaceae bacterium]